MRKNKANDKISSSSRGVKVDPKSVAEPRSKEEWVKFFNQISQELNQNNESESSKGKSVIVDSSNNNNVDHLQMNHQAMGGIHFQEDILIDILNRLPPRSLLRFKCTSKRWNTLIGDPFLKMMAKLSAEERMDCALNIMGYVVHLIGLLNCRKDYVKEIMDMLHLPLYETEWLGYDYGSFLWPLEGDNPEDEENAAEERYNEEVDNDESGNGLEYDDAAEDNEEVYNDESGDGSDTDGADDGKKGELSVEEIVNSTDNILHTLCYIVPMVEGLYKDKKDNLKEIQDGYPLSRLERQLLGYDSWSDVHPSDHERKEVNVAISGNGYGVGADDGAPGSAGAAA